MSIRRRLKIRALIQEARSLGLFDENWYAATHADVRRSRISSRKHFSNSGYKELRDPSPYFHVRSYLFYNNGAADFPEGGLAHYLAIGRAKGSKPYPVPTIEGYIDGLRDEALEGWIRETQPPRLPVAIRFIVDGDPIEDLILCNEPRDDLSAQGLGATAFHWRPPDRFCDDKMHDVAVISAETGSLLLESPYKIYFPRRVIVPPEAKVPEAAADEIENPLSTVNIHGCGEKPAISVVIPTYNRAPLIEKTLQNLFVGIGSDPIEVIVVDDGSSDESPDVLAYKQRQYSGLKVIRKENGGPGPARNLGAKEARADLVMFVGDDTRLVDQSFFRQHFQVHAAFPQPSRAVLGKVRWPEGKDGFPNFVMQHVQGEGQQQHGFKYMRPWTLYNWAFFYTSNVSMKKAMVADWEVDGFSSAFYAYGFEDGEFAYRLTKKNPDFAILYAPTAVMEHHHPYTVEGFMKRQTNCGLMADVFLTLHPELKTTLIGEPLLLQLQQPSTPNETARLESYLAAVEGIKAWAMIIDAHYGLGSQNWHGDFLKAVFRLCFTSGYLITQTNEPLNVSRAYRHVLEQFRTDLGTAISTEIIGLYPGFGFI
jgi:GT2 family glycosyltransferase